MSTHGQDPGQPPRHAAQPQQPAGPVLSGSYQQAAAQQAAQQAAAQQAAAQQAAAQQAAQQQAAQQEAARQFAAQQAAAQQYAAQQEAAQRYAAQQAASQQAAYPVGQYAQPAPAPALGRDAASTGQAGTAQAGTAQAGTAQAGTAQGRHGTAGQAGTIAQAASVALATPAQQAASAGLATAAPVVPPRGTVYGNHQLTDAPDHGLPPGRMSRLRINSHVVSLPTLARMTMASPGSGLILGADLERRVVPVRMFRAEPTRVTLVGGAWAAHLVLFRALALGTRTVVMTAEPARWQGLGERATGESGRVVVMHGERPMGFAATPQQPTLVIYDLGLVGPSTAPALGPWQTQLTVLRRLDETGVPAVQECQLVIFQRLALVEAALAASALQLTSQTTQLLQRMGDDMLALLGGGADRYVWVSQTDTEKQFIGLPQR